MATTATNALDKPTGYIIVSDGVGRIYTTLMHWMNTLANRDTNLHDNIFATKGKLTNTHGQVVEVDRSVFNIPTAVVHTHHGCHSCCDYRGS